VTLAWIDLIEGSPELDPRWLELCTADPISAGAAEPLDFARIGAALAHKLLTLGSRAGASLELAAAAPPLLMAGLFAHLAERGEHDSAAGQIMAALLERSSLGAFFERVDWTQLRPQLGSALCGAALARGSDPGELVRALERMPAETALAALITCPALVPHAQPVLERLIAAQPHSCGPLLCDLVRASHAGALAVGTALLACQGAGLDRAALEASLLALVQAALGARFVQPLWDARGLTSAVRLAALKALGADSDLLTEALRSRRKGLLEPPEIREALEELRWGGTR
jgi:hypothetical protein